MGRLPIFFLHCYNANVIAKRRTSIRDHLPFQAKQLGCHCHNHTVWTLTYIESHTHQLRRINRSRNRTTWTGLKQALGPKQKSGGRGVRDGSVFVHSCNALQLKSTMRHIVFNISIFTIHFSLLYGFWLQHNGILLSLRMPVVLLQYCLYFLVT